VPETNVERVRRAVAAYSARELDVLLPLIDPDAEWEPAGPAAVERALYKGREQFAAETETLWQVWEVLRFQERSIRDLGDDSVLWLGRAHLKARASGVELDQEFANLITLREGLLRRVKAFTSWEEARAASGLTE